MLRWPSWSRTKTASSSESSSMAVAAPWRNRCGQAGVRTAPLRGISWTANKFAVETFIDEIAVKRGIDPVAYRLELIKDPRARKVVDTVNDLDNVLYEVTNETAISAAKGELAVEWIEPATGKTVNGGAMPGGARRDLKAPFAGPSVLDLKAK